MQSTRYYKRRSKRKNSKRALASSSMKKKNTLANSTHKALTEQFAPHVIDASELYEVRMIVMMETAPQSNVYNQVLLTREHLKKVSKAVEASGEQVECEVHGGTHAHLIVDDLEIAMPEHLASVHVKKD